LEGLSSNCVSATESEVSENEKGREVPQAEEKSIEMATEEEEAKKEGK